MYDKQFDDLYLGNKQTRTESGHNYRENAMLDKLSVLKAQVKENYRRSLLHPELIAGAKIPTEIPQETATAQLFYNGQITPNSAGRFLIVIDPSIQTANLYNSESLNGTGTSGSATTINFDQDSNIIDMFRLVSESVIITYSGSLDKMAGYIVGCVTSNISIAADTPFFTFSNIENIQNKRMVSPIDGIKLIYSPYDNQQLEYQTMSNYTAGTAPQRWKKVFVIYGEGLPPTTCLRWDICRNIEYVSRSTLREYIPHDLATPCNYDANVITEIKRKEVTSAPKITQGNPFANTNPGLTLDRDEFMKFGQDLISKYMPNPMNYMNSVFK
jgi:hypothetical protein